MRKLLILLSLTFPLIDLLAEPEQKKPCKVPGATIQWELDHCFLAAETDDEGHDLVQACMDLVPHTQKTEDCARNLKLKRYRCLYLSISGEMKLPIKDCINSNEYVGSTVSNGGIGG